MINVLYDDRGFRQQFGGVAKCFCEAIKRLPQDVCWRVAARTTENEFLHEYPFNVRKSLFDFVSRLRFVGWRYRQWQQRNNDRYFENLAKSKEIQVVHITEPHYYNNCWKAIPKNKPFVVTVHDLIPEMIWHRDDVREERARVLSAARRIIAVSNFTKEKLLELYEVPEEKIKVVYHGSDSLPASQRIASLEGQKFILYVGARYDYKNFFWFIAAMKPILKKHSELKIVCTGVPFKDTENNRLRALAIRDKVQHVYATDAQMAWLYSNAACFIYPSSIEGFGIPIIDAFKARCPVVLPKSSCFPEVAGDAALFYEAGDEDNMRQQVMRIVEMPQCVDGYKKKGELRARNFTWDLAANSLAEIYREVVA